MATKSKPKKAATKRAAPKKVAERKPKAAPASVAVAAVPPQPRDDSGETVVFAIRLKRSERDEIHDATGPAKASSFVRSLALAAARGDMKLVQEIVDAVHETR
jgi:hypothetical protein